MIISLGATLIAGLIYDNFEVVMSHMLGFATLETTIYMTVILHIF